MTADWSRGFEESIIPARGKRGRTRQLVTLKDAGEYITKLPKAEHSATGWQTAMEAETAPTLLSMRFKKAAFASQRP